jgi:hypothetical protein
MARVPNTFIIDMVHHNPGEKPFQTAFTDPNYLKDLGYNGQCFKHLNTVMRFPSLNTITVPSDAENRWLELWEVKLSDEIKRARDAGLKVFFHLDLFVLPRRIVDIFEDEIRDPGSNLISLRRPKTLELHSLLFAEMFDRFPDVYGIFPRIGETYLFDTPFHCGNGAVVYSGEQYSSGEIEEFTILLKFLRDEICEKHNRYVLHRTWDIENNRFHSNPDFYLAVTDSIPPHENLLFSIKHSHIDFHRYARWNPCLGVGQHRQVIEVQCQREYEGKGAYPNFSSSGVIDGFPEMDEGNGLRSFMDHKLFAGIFSWSRGGGWHGPYLNRDNEFWIDINVRYLLKFLQHPKWDEQTLLINVFTVDLKMEDADAGILYRIAKGSMDAVLKGKFCRAWDTRDGAQHDRFPTNQWMRDDVLGGLDLLEPVFLYLYKSSQIGQAIREKFESVHLWQELVDESHKLSLADHSELKSIIVGSCEHGLRLYSFIAYAWQTLLLAYKLKHGESVCLDKIDSSLAVSDESWAWYCDLEQLYPKGGTLYRAHGWYWPNTQCPPGIGAALDDVRELLTNKRTK